MNQKGNIDEQLLRAYQLSDYHILQPNIPILLDRQSSDLDTLLIDNNCFEACLITAYNPHSQLVDLIKNQNNQQTMRDWLSAHGYLNLDAQSSDPTGIWPDEAQLFVLGLGKKVGGDLARQFRQNAYLYIAVNQPTMLVWV